MKSENQKKHKISSQVEASGCTSHCEGQCTPACTSGGHCVANISTAKRPTRQHMLDWLYRT